MLELLYEVPDLVWAYILITLSHFTILLKKREDLRNPKEPKFKMTKDFPEYKMLIISIFWFPLLGIIIPIMNVFKGLKQLFNLMKSKLIKKKT